MLQITKCLANDKLVEKQICLKLITSGPVEKSLPEVEKWVRKGGGLLARLLSQT